jgi:hypothetical protein
MGKGRGFGGGRAIPGTCPGVDSRDPQDLCEADGTDACGPRAGLDLHGMPIGVLRDASIPIGLRLEPLTFGPPVVGFIRSKADGDQQLSADAAGVQAAAATLFGVGYWTGLTNLRTDANVPDGYVGQSAAEAVESAVLAPGIYTSGYIIDDVQLLTQGPEDFASIDIYGSDSRFPEPIWHLEVVARGMLMSEDDLLINFDSLAPYNIADADIESTLRGYFEVSNGMAHLSKPFYLFSLTYSFDRRFPQRWGPPPSAFPNPLPPYSCSRACC